MKVFFIALTLIPFASMCRQFAHFKINDSYVWNYDLAPIEFPLQSGGGKGYYLEGVYKEI